MISNFTKLSEIEEKIKIADKIAIAGHVRPDGDCIGACMAFYCYICDNYGGNSKQIDVYLESIPESFSFLKGLNVVKNAVNANEKYDLFIALDCGDTERLGDAAVFLDTSDYSITVDHHITNVGYGKSYYIKPDASSTCEALCDIFEENLIALDTANALYLGIVHDSGVFKHSNTTRRTMECGGMLIEKGVSPTAIIDGTFYEKTYVQNQILGRCLLESILAMDGKVIVSYIDRKTQAFYNLAPADMDGIIDQMRVTKGVEVAILLKEDEPLTWKVSMRSNSVIDVSRICMMFGGGGHVRAAGCTLKGSYFDAVNSLTGCIESQYQKI